MSPPALNPNLYYSHECNFFFVLCILGSGLLLPISSAGQPAIFVYSATATLRHDSIPVAVQALKEHAHNMNATIEAMENEGAFREMNLPRFDVVTFLSNTGEGTYYPSESHAPIFSANEIMLVVLSQTGKDASQDYFRAFLIL